MSNFGLLPVDATSDSDPEPSPSPSPTKPTSSATTPSKKSAARKRAALRKKASQSGLSTPEPPSTSLVPPVPTLDVKEVEKKVNGVKKEVEEKVKVGKEAIKESIAPAAKAAKVEKKDLPLADVPTTTAATIAEDSSDAETLPDDQNYDDDDLSDDEASPTTTTSLPPAPPSPKLTEKKEAYTGADHDPTKKLKAIITRTVWGLAMVLSLVALVCLGQVYVIILVFGCQAVVFSELSGLFDAGYSNGHTGGVGQGMAVVDREKEKRRKGRREERDRWSRRMSWYFFAATNYFLYGESLIYYFKHILTLQASFLPTAFSFAQHHRLISFGLYIIGFVSFVANLTRAQLRRQFGLFGWIHMSLLLVVVSSHFIVNNILEGLIWFWVPASLVIMNDIAAYVCGMAFGRHQLIKLSPKKTVEGFVGAFFVTIVFAVLWGTFFMRFNYMICPVQDLATNILTEMHCVPNKVFVWRDFPLPVWAVQFLKSVTTKTFASIPWAPFQLHCVVMAIFASLVAPFGGFFASGFKRAFNIKDFGDSIPGHGGMTDRMDCQFLMGLFSYVYYASLIRESHMTVGSVLATIQMGLTTEEQLELLGELGKYLAQKGIKAATPW